MALGFSKALLLGTAGFAAGVAAVIACDGGPNDAEAESCSTCEVTGPVAMRVPVCAQWEMLFHTPRIESPPFDPGTGAPLDVTLPAPEGWEPIGPAGTPYTTTLLLRRCARWGAHAP